MHGCVKAEVANTQQTIFTAIRERRHICPRIIIFHVIFFFSFLLFKRIEIKKQLLTKAKLRGRSTPGTLYPLPRALPHHSYVETSRGQLLNIQATIWNATLAASKPHRHTCLGGGVCVSVWYARQMRLTPFKKVTRELKQLDCSDCWPAGRDTYRTHGTLCPLSLAGEVNKSVCHANA